MTDFRLLKVREAAEIMGVSVTQFYRIRVPHVRLTPNGDRRWDIRTLEAFAEKRESRKSYLREVRAAAEAHRK